MKKRKHLIFALPAAAATLALAVPPVASAGYDDDEIPFAVADVYAELNDTDGDLGFHTLVDGDAWSKLAITDLWDRKLLDVKVRGRLRRQGLTELFFESAEPPFDELAPEEFFDRFPEGEYEIEGRTLEGEELESEDLFWHVMPAQPGLQEDGETVRIEVGGVMDEVEREKCDDEDPAYGPIEVPSDTVTIAWDPVTGSHPTIGRNGPIEVAHYQVVVQPENRPASVLSVDLPDSQTAMTIPEEFLALGDEFKYEVLVKESAGGNQTAVESCFVLVD